MTADPPEIVPSAASSDGPATIFVSDASAEADRLSTALRSRGYAVVDVPLSLLLARVAVQRAALILLDIDAEGALDVIERLRDLLGTATPDLFLLGDPNKALPDPRAAQKREDKNFFARPVDVLSLTARVEAVVGSQLSLTQSFRAPLPSTPSSAPSSEPRPVSSKPPFERTQVQPPSRPSLLPDRAGSVQPVVPVMSTFPESWSDRAPPQSQGPIAHSLESGPWKVPLGLARIPTASLSPEIEALLQGAEARISQDPAPSSQPPTPDEEVEAVLPAEVLAALDEPIDGDEEDGDSGSGSGSPTPGKSTTGSRDRTTGHDFGPHWT